MLLCTAEQMRAMDQYTIRDIGLPGRVLMELAGRGVAEAVGNSIDSASGSEVLVIAGPGNNGGDGLVAARHLADKGAKVTVVLMTDPDRLQGNALANYESLRSFPVCIRPVRTNEELQDALAGEWDAVVDALLGTGLSKPVTGMYAQAVELANTINAFKVAVDIPTGVDSDHGRIMGTAFIADISVTFGMAKVGHFVYPGREYCGFVKVIDISIPQLAIQDTGISGFTPESWTVAPFFTARHASAFKNDFGHLLIVGGSPGKAGAILLAGESALRTGAGLVTLATSKQTQTSLEGRVPDLMVEDLYEFNDGNLHFDKARLDGLVLGKTAIVVGPGLGVSTGVADLIRTLAGYGLPMLLDADALNTLAMHRELLPIVHGAVLTPHPGEAARILQADGGAAIQADRMAAVIDLQKVTGCVIVLKGAGTLTMGMDGQVTVNTSGGPGLAVAGTGDCLTGVIGALLAQGLTRIDAAWVGAYIHGLAGELAADEFGEYGVTASEVSRCIPLVIKELSFADNSKTTY